VTGPMPMDSPRRRRRARRQLARALQRLADRAAELDVTVWRIQPVVEVCGAGHYVAWRAARSRAWKRDGAKWTTNTWPERLHEPQSAAVLLPQSHGGHWRGQPAEIALPVFASGPVRTGRDVEHPYEVHVLALMLSWASIAVDETNGSNRFHGALLAPPLVDLIGRRPLPRVPCDLGLSWPLLPSEPHIRPSRQA
jgi:hypothetical protein